MYEEHDEHLTYMEDYIYRVDNYEEGITEGKKENYLLYVYRNSCKFFRG